MKMVSVYYSIMALGLTDVLSDYSEALFLFVIDNGTSNVTITIEKLNKVCDRRKTAMKKRMLVLWLLAALLCLNACAYPRMEAAGFSFTPEEYMAAFTDLVADSAGIEVVWSGPEPINENQRLWVGRAENMPEIRLYTSGDGAACQTIGTEAVTKRGVDSHTGLGIGISFILYTTRYLELRQDMEAFLQEWETIAGEYEALVGKVFREATETWYVDRIYGKEAIIAGHVAQFYVVLDPETLLLSNSFIYQP